MMRKKKTKAGKMMKKKKTKAEKMKKVLLRGGMTTRAPVSHGVATVLHRVVGLGLQISRLPPKKLLGVASAAAACVTPLLHLEGPLHRSHRPSRSTTTRSSGAQWLQGRDHEGQHPPLGELAPLH